MTDITETMTHGQCLCGAVKFHGVLSARGVGACHCGQCRRWAGGAPFMATRFEGGVTFDADETLVWFKSSEEGERGFCNRCGSSLFWRAPGAGTDMAISAGALPDQDVLRMHEHIWIDDKPDWYDFADETPRLTAAQALGQVD